jgi:glycine/D-amino acid oxidase-like deaminating enzyme
MTYWTSTCFPLKGTQEKPKDGGILIVGAGLAGTSAAHFLKDEFDVQLVDCGTENASYFRNAGHILFGASENYKSFIDIHGREKARDIFKMSEAFCLLQRATILENNIQCDYFQGDYHSVASNSREEEQIIESIDLLNQDDMKHSYYTTARSIYDKIGFKSNLGGKVCNLSAQGHPVKFRNALLSDVPYFSYKIKNIEDLDEKVKVEYFDGSFSEHDALVIAGNAYSPLFSSFFSDRKLIEPFKGQIIVSEPLENIKRSSFSCDHGYIYGTYTSDNRLLIGGWRNNVPGKEVGTYDLEINPLTENGLKQYIADHFGRNVKFEFSWSGIMGANQSGLPYVGPTNSPLVFALTACNGYGFSWSHGCAKLLSDIIKGNPLMQGWQHLNPNKF